jgi:hypothetical protein
LKVAPKKEKNIKEDFHRQIKLLPNIVGQSASYEKALLNDIGLEYKKVETEKLFRKEVIRGAPISRGSSGTLNARQTKKIIFRMY